MLEHNFLQSEQLKQFIATTCFVSEVELNLKLVGSYLTFVDYKEIFVLYIVLRKMNCSFLSAHVIMYSKL